MFQLDGKTCVDPAILKMTFRDAGFSIWWEKYSPNHFRHQCGVDPGKGYLLLKGSDLPAASTTVPLTIGSVTIPKVVVLKSVELEAVAGTVQGNVTRLVEIADIRHYLKRTQVKKNYNVIRFVDTDGSEVFDESTMNEVSPGSYINWTWTTLLNDLWDGSLLSGETLNLGDVTFPEVFPHNYYFETWSHRDALARVLLDLGLTLEPSTGSTWRVIHVSTDSTYLATVNQLSSKLIQSNNIEDGKGSDLPAKLIFHFSFPEESPAGKQNRTYKYEHTVVAQHSYQSILSNSHDSIWSPLQAAFDFTNPTEPLNKVDLDAFAAGRATNLTKLLYTDDGHDKTFGGFLNVYPSADIGRVTWKDTGSNISSDGTGPTTRLEHCFPVAKPPSSSRPSVPLQKVVGNPVSNVTPEVPTFQLTNLQLISGVKPQEPLTVNNTYGQSFTALERVEAEYSYESLQWDTPQKGSSENSSPSSLIRFELAQDKSLLDQTADAFEINLLDFQVRPIKVFDRLTRKFVGFAEYIDPQFGYQHGYRGWAQYSFTTTTVDEETEEEISIPHYDIITLEGPARWITGVTYGRVERDAEDFKGTVEEYWGAFPNHRPPATTEIEGTGGESEYYVNIYDYQNIISNQIEAGTKYCAVYDEGRNLYVLTSIDSQATTFPVGLLLQNVPAATIDINARTVIPGRTIDAVLVMRLNDDGNYVATTELVAAINTSQTPFQVDDQISNGRLVMVHGPILKTNLGDDVIADAMRIIPFDAASTPNFDPAEIQVFYKTSNSKAMTMDKDECPE